MIFNVWISNCYFYDMSNNVGNGHGGAIYWTVAGGKILIESSTFFSTNAKYYGAICIYNGNAVFNRICGYKCSSSNNVCFSTIQGSSRTINTVHDSSVAYCVASSYYTMYHYYGCIDIKSVNLSHNKASSYSALTCRPSSTNGGTYGTNISYSSFSNNTASSQWCIYLRYSNSVAKQYEINNSNIIENSGDQTIYVYYGELTMRKTCMMNNKKATYYFYLRQSGVKCTLIDCSIDNTDKTGSGSLSRTGSTDSFINGLTFISTGDCKNIIDTISGVPLTGIIERIKVCFIINFMEQNLNVKDRNENKNIHLILL